MREVTDSDLPRGMRRGQVFQRVRFTGTGSRQFLFRGFALRIVALEGIDRVDVGPYQDESLPILADGNDTLYVVAKGDWAFIAHTLQLLPIEEKPLQPWELLPCFPTPTKDNDVIDVMPYTQERSFT